MFIYITLRVNITVGMTERAQSASAFVIRNGLYQFMPFGLVNAPATFERLIETVLRGLQWQHCLVYLDDIIVFANSPKEKVERLDKILQKLENAGLKLKAKKCRLFCKEDSI